MLYYTEVCLSPYEVPGEQSICIYISGCLNRCKNCHYPELQYPDYGDVLSKRMSDIVALYHSQASCVCFLGEGRALPETPLCGKTQRGSNNKSGRIKKIE